MLAKFTKMIHKGLAKFEYKLKMKIKLVSVKVFPSICDVAKGDEQSIGRLAKFCVQVK